MPGYLDDIRTSYDMVASSYAELVQQPAGGEDEAIDLLADLGAGTVLDVGCGPGRLTARLRERGMRVIGLDLSIGMIQIAQRDHPTIGFAVGSMTDLPFPDARIAGVISWWSLIHLPRAVVPRALEECHRVLGPGGVLLLGFHAGAGSTHKTSGYGGHAMNVQVHRWQPEELTALAVAAGFTPHLAPVLPEDIVCFLKPRGD